MRIKQTARKSTSVNHTCSASWETFNRRRIVLMTSNQANSRENVRPSSSPDQRDLRARTDRAIAASRISYRVTNRATARKSTGMPAFQSGSKMLRKNPKDDVSPKYESGSGCRPKREHNTSRRDDDADDDDAGPGPSRRSPPRTRSQANAIKAEASGNV
jgi:hypothetical protein